MSSSCVPPKGCVLRDPGPTSQEYNDTVSECGSLCTCTSDSLTSLAEIRESERVERVGRAESQHSETSRQEERGNPERIGHAGGRSQGREGDSRNPRRAENPGRGSRCEGRNPDRSGRRNREIEPSRETTIRTRPLDLTSPCISWPSDNHTGFGQQQQPLHRHAGTIAGHAGVRPLRNVPGRLSIHAAVKETLLTACEFLPWVAGLVIIYYCFLWWGIGSSFGAFLLMMGAHAVMRFMKTRGAFQWPNYLSSRDHHQPAASDSDDDDYDDDDNDTIETGFEPVPDLSAEKPPSYESAVVKPPPYDLQYHLTPTQQPRGQVRSSKVVSGQTEMKVENEEDVFLPSYHDAVALTDGGEAGNT